jgi:hypothetical protein
VFQVLENLTLESSPGAVMSAPYRIMIAIPGGKLKVLFYTDIYKELLLANFDAITAFSFME